MTDIVTVYLSLGSNLANRQANLDMALKLLSERMRMGKVSSIYDTEPLGNTSTAHGDDLINQTIQGLRELNPELIMAGHCTGFRALTKLAAAFPDNFMVSCVGTKVMVVGG